MLKNTNYPRDVSVSLTNCKRPIGDVMIKGIMNGKEYKDKFTVWISTEDIIISIIKPHKDFSDTINQHDIAAEYMERRNEYISARKVRKIIEELIEEGYPIISTPVDPGGYCWSGADGEVLECYKRLRKKGIKILIRARRILRNSQRGQLKIFDIS